MLAFFFSLLLFLFFTFLGGAVLHVLRPWRSSLRTMLAAPGIGAATLVFPVFVLNRAGYPVRQFAFPLTILLLAVAAFLWWRIRPSIAWKRLVPFLCVLFCGAFAVGYPMLADGFNWISYGNNDMCSFVMTAHRFADHGYNELPDRGAFLRNQDIGAAYWFSYAIEGSRCGSDLLLAWLISLTHRTGFEVYMPALLALHLALIAAAGALVLGSSRRLAALAVCAWLAISPLTTLGTMYQLMPQVFGMTLLAIAAAFLLRPVRVANFSGIARFSLLSGGLVAMLAVAYYEILPFLIVAVAIYHPIQLLRRREKIRPTALAAAGATLVVLIFLRSWALLLVPFLERQAGRSFQPTNVDASVFPYYLIPSGLANLWGFLPIGAGVPSGRLADLAILAGGILLAAAIAACAWQARKARPAGILACVMLAVGARLFLDRGDFGLFKLAMYVQPFLLASLVLAWFSVAKTKLWRFVPLAIVAALGLRSQIYYVERSLGTPGSFVNLPYASRDALLAQLAHLRSENNVPIVSDTDNVILASLESIYLNPANVEFPAGDFFQHAANLDPASPQFRMSQRIAPELSRQALALVRARQAMDSAAIFDLKNASTNLFFHWTGKHYSNSALLETGPELSILNHRQIPANAGAIFIPNTEYADRLIPVASELGGSQSLTGRFGPDRGVALYSAEPDYFFPGSMAALGRYVLFRILYPSAKVRLVLDYTASLNADGENRVPPVVAIGDARVPFEARGRGAARLFSRPLTPQQIGQESYLMLDMGEVPFRMPNPRSGLMTLYGRDIRLDTRLMTGFARDISAISEEDYTALRAPAEIAKFPAALHNPNLEFSGIYEDGWASEDVSLTLDAPESSTLRVAGMAPQGLEITLLVDGQLAARQSFRAGEFTLASPQTFAPGRHRLEIRSSKTLRLTAPDTRLASFLIHRLGFGSK